jgi:hypothetical protein
MRGTTSNYLFLLWITIIPTALVSAVFGQGSISSDLRRVLIWNSPSGHENTEAINQWVVNIGLEYGFEVEATTDPTKFTALNLRNYDVIFPINGDFFGAAFSPEQKMAVEDFHASGKGLGCLHQCDRG